MTAKTQATRTPTLAETIKLLIDAKMCEMHTSTPAKIVSYDSGKNLAVVQPLIKRKYIDEDSPVELPTISDVPIAFPRMGDAWVRFPVDPDQEGQLIFNERSIDKWLDSGGSVDPDDPRKFSLSDAVFYPGLNSGANPMEPNGEDSSLELAFGKSFIEIKKDGKMKVSYQDTFELFEILIELMEQLKIATDSAGIPFNGGAIAAFEAIRLKFFLMKG